MTHLMPAEAPQLRLAGGAYLVGELCAWCCRLEVSQAGALISGPAAPQTSTYAISSRAQQAVEQALSKHYM
jgi:hypothetical protein